VLRVKAVDEGIGMTVGDEDLLAWIGLRLDAGMTLLKPTVPLFEVGRYDSDAQLHDDFAPVRAL
jgi:hypothetical protein